MLRHLATALLCALLVMVPNFSTPVAKPSSPSSSADGASPAALETSAADTIEHRAPGPARDASSSGPRHAALSADDRRLSISGAIDGEIGKEPDAILHPESEQNEPPKPLTRETICQVVREVAAENNIPASLFARLIWQESRFAPNVVSRAGARGIAQFMPATAAERGLKDPFDPIQALPASGRFLRELVGRFGNFGLAAAAYNGGPRRVRDWLAGQGGLPRETREYVIHITGRRAEHWAEAADHAEPHPEAKRFENCNLRPLHAASAELRGTERADTARQVAERMRATWIALLTGNWTQQRARTVYAGLQKKYPTSLGRRSPTVQVAKASGKKAPQKTMMRLTAESRAEAEELCKRLKETGGSCTVQKDPT
jgi:soluble lytic murein transglycosylase-like protein